MIISSSLGRNPFVHVYLHSSLRKVAAISGQKSTACRTLTLVMQHPHHWWACQHHAVAPPMSPNSMSVTTRITAV
eukprot:597667-Amphidinium_carterae.1